MPLTLDRFKEKRRKESELFNSHLVKQNDYLERVIYEAIKTLNEEQPKDTAKIKKFEKMAKALNMAAHSQESILTRNATLFALRKMDATQPVNKKALTLAKEQILQDPDFQLLSKKGHIARLQYLAENNESDYTAHANHVKKSKQPQKQISG